jgi:hypothetical protein
MPGKKKKKIKFSKKRKDDRGGGGGGGEEEVEKPGHNHLLHDIYFSPENPASLGSPLRLYKAAKKINSEINLEEVNDWLNSQPAYTLHREVKLHFPRRKVVVKAPKVQYQADLLDVSNIAKKNDNTRFLLTVIDCFSRLATAIPIKSKHAEVVKEGLEEAFTNLGGPPFKLQTDEGVEFKGHQVQKWLHSKAILWFHSYQSVKAQIVERFNRTLRNRLQKYQEYSGSLRYIEVLPRILKGYNSTIHSALKKFSPNQVNEKNTKEVFEIQYRKYLDRKKKKHKFKINDIVRISEYRSTFFKKTTSHNFTSELFVITDVLPDLNPPTYRLKALSDSEAIEGVFYESELQKVSVVDHVER